MVSGVSTIMSLRSRQPTMICLALSFPSTAQSSRDCFLGACLHVRLVDLDDVSTGGEEVPDLFVHDSGVRHGHRFVARVGVVLGLPRHRERAGHGHLDHFLRVRTQKAEVFDLNGMLAPDRSDDAGNRLGTARAAQGRAGLVDVDALERGGKSVRIALAPDLAGLSRSLLNLAERDGRASYPQFTAARGI